MRLPDPMHTCLCVDEVVRLIAHELVASEGKATSVALACCCKTLEDPTLDVLWQTQEQLLPLLKSLPGGVWDDGECIVSPLSDNVLPLLTHQSGLKVFPKTPNDV